MEASSDIPSAGCNCAALDACYEAACILEVVGCLFEKGRIASFCMCKNGGMKHCSKEDWDWVFAHCEDNEWKWADYNRQCSKVDLKAAFGKNYDEALQTTEEAVKESTKGAVKAK